MNLTAIMKRSDGSFLVKCVTGQQIELTELQVTELLGYQEAKRQIHFAQTRLNHWHPMGASRIQEALAKPGDVGDFNCLSGDEV